MTPKFRPGDIVVRLTDKNTKSYCKIISCDNKYYTYKIYFRRIFIGSIRLSIKSFENSSRYLTPEEKLNYYEF